MESSSKSLITTAGISLLVSSAVVMVNNYFFYRYHCKKTPTVCTCECAQVTENKDK